MATTTNYGWTTPDDTALVKDGASAIRTLGSSVDTTTKALNPSTTLGDIEYRSSTANTNTRLGIGTTGQVLTVSGGVPAWTTPSAGFVGCILQKTGAQALTGGVQTSITFTSEIIDTDGFHDNSTNTSRITIPAGKGGKYLVTGMVSFSGGTSNFVEIWKNGAFQNIFVDKTTSGGQSVSAIVNLVATDYLELSVYSGSSVNAVSNNFSVAYLGA
jgi:hypothetical protein